MRSGVLWGCIFGAFVVSSAYSYSTIYTTPAERNRLAETFGANHATSALFGPAPQLQTVAGFTVFKVLMTVMLLGAVWGLLTSTRLLRGEEDAGRWEIVLAGQTSRRGAAVQAMVGLACGGAALWAVTALVSAAAGRSSKIGFGVGPAMYLALALASTGIMFLAVGSVTSQLAATRRQAAAYAAAVLGASYALRMVADAGLDLQWLRWASPLGWVEQLQPMTGPEPVALVPIVAFTGVLAAVAAHLAGARDVGAATLPDRSHARARDRLLHGPVGLTVRLGRSTVLGWGASIAVTGLLFGLVAKSAGATISGSSMQEILARLGATGGGTGAYLGTAFLILAVLLAFVAAGQATAARGEESGGFLDHLLVRPVSRGRWFGGWLAVAVCVLVVGGMLAGVSAWLGTATQHSGQSFRSLLLAGVSVVPPAVCILGVGALAFGVLPRAVPTVVYGMLGWSLLVEVVGGIGALSHWVFDTSLFHQMGAAPATPPNWTAGAVMVGVGVVAAAVGAAAFRFRDLAGE